jgi:hypothetical protein
VGVKNQLNLNKLLLSIFLVLLLSSTVLAVNDPGHDSLYLQLIGGTLSGALTVNSYLNVTGNTYVGGNLIVSGDTNISGTLNMLVNRITNLANGTDSQDAVTLSQLQALNGTITGDFVPYTGADQNVNLGSYNLTTTGDITANYFIGNGSQLTGISNVTDSVYYIEGTGSVAGTWLGSHSRITEYYDGLKISYKIPVAGATTTTLNINGLGAIQVYVATSALTTHLPVNSVVYLTYTTVSGTGRWVWSNYADGVESYTVRWNGAGVIAGEQITRYKLLMMASDGRYHPIVTGDTTTANTKTINTQPFVVNSPILSYYTTASVNENAATATTSMYSAVAMSTNFAYNQNQISGWTAHKPIYLVGTINNDGLFVLEGAGTINTTYLTQTLPTTEDGKVYIMLGMMYSTTTSFRLNIEHPIIEFKNGKLREYVAEIDTNWNITGSNYLINSSNILELNETKLNTTIDARVSTNVPDIWVNESGDTMSGNLSMGGNYIQNLANGTLSQDAVTKSQLDAINASFSGDLSGYVPYTSATSNVNLGIYNLTTTGTISIGSNNVQQQLVGSCTYGIASVAENGTITCATQQGTGDVVGPSSANK